jgi:hypothetical protein
MAIAIAAVLRIVVVALADGYTPRDVTFFFRWAGQQVLKGQDPLTTLGPNQWNFLPFMPYVFALEIKTGLAWQVAVKLVPVAADLLTVFLVGRLCDDEDAATARLLYALSPVAILVTAWHGQVEPVAVALGLTGMVLAARRAAGSAGVAGVAAGLAAAAKTWPALFLTGILWSLPRRKWPLAVGTAIAVIAAWLAVAVGVLHDRLDRAVSGLTGYRSVTGTWGWSGLLHLTHHLGTGYTGVGIEEAQRVGTVVTVLAMLVVLGAFRTAPAPDVMGAVFLVFIVTTAGFGAQYLLWPVALLCTVWRRRPLALLYMVLATAYLGVFYLWAFPEPQIATGLVWTLEGLSLAVIVSAVLALPWAPGLRPLAWLRR